MAGQPSAQRTDAKQRAPIAGEAFLRALSDHGIDYFFANPGTDFPPIVEAFSRAKQSNAKVPQPLVIPVAPPIYYIPVVAPAPARKHHFFSR